jgi:phosphate starvation-inducible membrane PsiE
MVRLVIWWAFLLACLVSLIDLVGVAAVLGHSHPASAVRLACAALLLPIGMTVARNWIKARETLVERLTGAGRQHRSRHIARLQQQLFNLLLVMLGLAWVGLGTFSLVQGLSDIL